MSYLKNLIFTIDNIKHFKKDSNNIKSDIFYDHESEESINNIENEINIKHILARLRFFRYFLLFIINASIFYLFLHTLIFYQNRLIFQSSMGISSTNYILILLEILMILFNLMITVVLYRNHEKLSLIQKKRIFLILFFFNMLMIFSVCICYYSSTIILEENTNNENLSNNRLQRFLNTDYLKQTHNFKDSNDGNLFQRMSGVSEILEHQNLNITDDKGPEFKNLSMMRKNIKDYQNNSLIKTPDKSYLLFFKLSFQQIKDLSNVANNNFRNIQTNPNNKTYIKLDKNGQEMFFNITELISLLNNKSNSSSYYFVKVSDLNLLIPSHYKNLIQYFYFSIYVYYLGIIGETKFLYLTIAINETSLILFYSLGKSIETEEFMLIFFVNILLFLLCLLFENIYNIHRKYLIMSIRQLNFLLETITMLLNQLNCSYTLVSLDDNYESTRDQNKSKNEEELNKNKKIRSFYNKFFEKKIDQSEEMQILNNTLILKDLMNKNKFNKNKEKNNNLNVNVEKNIIEKIKINDYLSINNNIEINEQHIKAISNKYESTINKRIELLNDNSYINKEIKDFKNNILITNTIEDIKESDIHQTTNNNLIQDEKFNINILYSNFKKSEKARIMNNDMMSSHFAYNSDSLQDYLLLDDLHKINFSHDKTTNQKIPNDNYFSIKIDNIQKKNKLSIINKNSNVIQEINNSSLAINMNNINLDNNVNQSVLKKNSYENCTMNNSNQFINIFPIKKKFNNSQITRKYFNIQKINTNGFSSSNINIINNSPKVNNLNINFSPKKSSNFKNYCNKLNIHSNSKINQNFENLNDTNISNNCLDHNLTNGSFLTSGKINEVKYTKPVNLHQIFKTGRRGENDIDKINGSGIFSNNIDVKIQEKENNNTFKNLNFIKIPTYHDIANRIELTNINKSHICFENNWQVNQNFFINKKKSFSLSPSNNLFGKKKIYLRDSLLIKTDSLMDKKFIYKNSKTIDSKIIYLNGTRINQNLNVSVCNYENYNCKNNKNPLTMHSNFKKKNFFVKPSFKLDEKTLSNRKFNQNLSNTSFESESCIDDLKINNNNNYQKSNYLNLKNKPNSLDMTNSKITTKHKFNDEIIQTGNRRNSIISKLENNYKSRGSFKEKLISENEVNKKPGEANIVRIPPENSYKLFENIIIDDYDAEGEKIHLKDILRKIYKSQKGNCIFYV